MKRIVTLLLLLACSAGSTSPPADATSGDYVFVRRGSGLLVQDQIGLTDTAALEVQVRGQSRPVIGVEIHYRVTLGALHHTADTTDANGLTSYFWVVPRVSGDTASIYVCAFIAGACVEDRLTGYFFP